MNTDSLEELRTAASNGACLRDLAGIVDVPPATLSRWLRWVDYNAADIVPPPPDPLDELSDIMHPAPTPSLGEGEDPENVRAVVGAIREGRSAGRRAMQQERRAIIDRKEWRTGDADRLRAIDRTLADLAVGALD